MKNKLLLLAAVLLTTLSARAVDVIEEGVDYYIINVETNQFLGAQNYWGCQLTISEDAGIYQFELGVQDGAPAYNIKNTIMNGTYQYAGTDLYNDKLTNITASLTSNEGRGTIDIKDDEEAGTTKRVDGIWNVQPLGGGKFAFFCNSSWAYTDGAWVETKYGYMTRSETDGYRKGKICEFKEELTSAAEFYIMTRDEAMAYIANIAQSNNVSYNFLIKNPDFCRNQSTSAWTVSADCTNKNLAGGAVNNMCAESYHSTFTISQVIYGLPAGRYQLSAQGFYRKDSGSTDAKPVVFAGSTEVALPVRTGTENSMTDASNSFAQGKYNADKVRFQLEETTDLEVGFRLQNNDKATWVIFDNIQLMSYSNVPEYAAEVLAGISYPIEGLGSASVKAEYDAQYNSFKTWVENMTQGSATFDEVDEKYDAFVAAENAWKESIELWEPYSTTVAKARKLYRQVASGDHAASNAFEALTDYLNGSAEIVTPGYVDFEYTFVNGGYNYIAANSPMADEAAITAEVEFLEGLMKDTKNQVIQVGMDVTFLLENPDFTETGGAGWNGVSGITDAHGGLSGWPVAEAYGKSSFDFYQIVENVPAGVYEIGVNAFYRPSGNGSWTGEESVPVEIYMGSFKNPIQHIAADAVENDLVQDTSAPGGWADGTIALNGTNVLWNGADADMPSGTTVAIVANNKNEDADIQAAMSSSTIIGGSDISDYNWDDNGVNKLVPNGMSGASVAFSAGRYPMTVKGNVEEGTAGSGMGTMRIGIRATSAMHWALWSNFTLKYVGEDTSVMKEQLQARMNEMQALIDEQGENDFAVQEVLRKDTVDTWMVIAANRIADATVSYADVKEAHDVLSAAIDSWNAYKTVINDVNDKAAELTVLLETPGAPEEVKEEATLYIDVFQGLINYGQVCRTEIDGDNFAAYYAEFGEEWYPIETREDAEAFQTDEYYGYYMTIDKINSVYSRLKIQLSAKTLEVDESATAAAPYEATDQLSNPDFQLDTQWNGTAAKEIKTANSGIAEWYESVFDAYQTYLMPAGHYTLMTRAMDRHVGWDVILAGNATDEDNKYATYLYVAKNVDTDADTTSVIIANGGRVALREKLVDSATELDVNGTLWYYPNGMDAYNEWVTACREDEAEYPFNGLETLDFDLDTDTYCSFGFYRRQISGVSWFITDGIQLFYASDATPETGISSIEAENESALGKQDGKYLENGKIVIYINGKKFNIAGQAIK